MANTSRPTTGHEERAALLPNGLGEHDEEESSPIIKRKQRTERWKRVAIYTALVLLGILVGSLVTLGARRAEQTGTPPKPEKGDDGPRVPPIYKLPPVRASRLSG